ncbi:MAG: hypothetical protein IIB62_08250 [Proteobacteria bacterium]|nr:hypothetical protein [Pseudomonadota bacterium]
MRKLDARCKTVERVLQRFDGYSDLNVISLVDIKQLLKDLKAADGICQDMLKEHARRERSQLWLWISVACGIGGFYATGDPDIVALIISLGGVLGSGQSVSDFYNHQNEEQIYRTLAWSVTMRKNKLDAALVRRGIQ